MSVAEHGAAVILSSGGSAAGRRERAVTGRLAHRIMVDGGGHEDGTVGGNQLLRKAQMTNFVVSIITTL